MQIQAIHTNLIAERKLFLEIDRDYTFHEYIRTPFHQKMWGLVPEITVLFGCAVFSSNARVGIAYGAISTITTSFILIVLKQADSMRAADLPVLKSLTSFYDSFKKTILMGIFSKAVQAFICFNLKALISHLFPTLDERKIRIIALSLTAGGVTGSVAMLRWDYLTSKGQSNKFLPIVLPSVCSVGYCILSEKMGISALAPSLLATISVQRFILAKKVEKDPYFRSLLEIDIPEPA